MLRHTCKVEEQQVLGQRPNPLDPTWSEWTLVRCSRCQTICEWQHHSAEQGHGGDLEITAQATPDYVRHIYGLTEGDIAQMVLGKKLARCYNRYTRQYEESTI